MSVYYEDDAVVLHHGDALEVARTLPCGLARTIVTSPPYYRLRDYGEEAQYGAEASVGEYVARMVELFRELRRVLADDGTLWLNLGDSYGAGKQLLGVPWLVAFALQKDGWILRSDIIWSKPNPMPESVTDRPTKAHEYLFLFSKTQHYHYDAAATLEPFKNGAGWVGRESKSFKANPDRADGGKPTSTAREGGRNKRTIWEVSSVPFPGGHFAAYPPELIRPCIRAGSAPGDTVLDPFSGSGTTGAVANFEGRKYVGIELNKDYLDLSLRTRFQQPTLPWGGDAD